MGQVLNEMDVGLLIVMGLQKTPQIFCPAGKANLFDELRTERKIVRVKISSLLNFYLAALQVVDCQFVG